MDFGAMYFKTLKWATAHAHKYTHNVNDTQTVSINALLNDVHKFKNWNKNEIYAGAKRLQLRNRFNMRIEVCFHFRPKMRIKRYIHYPNFI